MFSIRILERATNWKIAKLIWVIAYIVFVPLILVLAPCHILHGQDVFIEILQSRLQHSTKYAWSCAEQWKQRAPLDFSKIPSSVVDPLERAHKQGVSAFKEAEIEAIAGSACFEMVDGRSKFEYTQASKNYQYYSDGKTVTTIMPTQMQEGGIGPTMVDIGAGKGTINFFESAKYAIGWEYQPMQVVQRESCFGGVENSIPLDEFIYLLKDSKVKKTISEQDGRYIVRLPSFHENNMSGEMTYEFGADGALEFVAWKAGKNWSPSLTIAIENEIASFGIRVPRKVEYVDWAGGRLRSMHFSNWRIPSAEDFTFDIPENAVVTDHINQLVYTKVEGTLTESRAARLYALQHGLQLPDPESRGNTIAFFIVVAAASVLALAIVYKWRHGNSLALLCVLMPSSGCSNASTVNDDEAIQLVGKQESFAVWHEGIGWKTQGHGGRDTYISQCGLKVSLLAIEMSGRAHDAMVVAKMLEPTNKGIRMSDIKAVLEAHAIEVTARKSLEMADIVEMSYRYDFAIVHLPEYQSLGYIEPHYAIVYRDVRGDVVFIDPPRAPIILSGQSSGRFSNLSGLTALFCEKEVPEEIKARWDVSVDRVVADPGDFKDGRFSAQISLVNHSDSTVAITGAKVSCPCVELDFEPCAIPPDRSRLVNVSIEKMKWTGGEQRIFLSDAAGNVRTVVVEGTSWEPVSEDGLHTDSKSSTTPFVVTRALFIPLNCGKLSHRLSFCIPIFEDVPEGAFAYCESKTIDASVVSRDASAAIEGYVDVSEDEIVAAASSGVHHDMYIMRDSIKIGRVRLSLHRTVGLMHQICESQDGRDVVFSLKDCDGWELESFLVNVGEASKPERIGDGRWRVALIAPEAEDSRCLLGRATLAHPEHASIEKRILLQLNSITNPVSSLR